MYSHLFNRHLCAMIFSFSCNEGVATSAKHEGQGQQKDEEIMVYGLINLHYICGGRPMVPFTEHESDTFE
jgi:hypothetical protein